jgi:hypothetical protein
MEGIEYQIQECELLIHFEEYEKANILLNYLIKHHSQLIEEELGVLLTFKSFMNLQRNDYPSSLRYSEEALSKTFNRLSIAALFYRFAASIFISNTVEEICHQLKKSLIYLESFYECIKGNHQQYLSNLISLKILMLIASSRYTNIKKDEQIIGEIDFLSKINTGQWEFCVLKYLQSLLLHPIKTSSEQQAIHRLISYIESQVTISEDLKKECVLLKTIVVLHTWFCPKMQVTGYKKLNAYDAYLRDINEPSLCNTNNIHEVLLRLKAEIKTFGFKKERSRELAITSAVLDFVDWKGSEMKSDENNYSSEFIFQKLRDSLQLNEQNTEPKTALDHYACIALLSSPYADVKFIYSAYFQDLKNHVFQHQTFCQIPSFLANQIITVFSGFIYNFEAPKILAPHAPDICSTVGENFKFSITIILQKSFEEQGYIFSIRVADRLDRKKSNETSYFSVETVENYTSLNCSFEEFMKQDNTDAAIRSLIETFKDLPNKITALILADDSIDLIGIQDKIQNLYPEIKYFAKDFGKIALII